MMARDLKADLALIRSTTPGTWYVVDTDDEYHATMLMISTDPVGEDPGSRVAVTLLQFPATANVRDKRWDENSRFIVEAHNGGWEEAIQRALAAEARVAELEARLARLKLVLRELGGRWA